MASNRYIQAIMKPPSRDWREVVAPDEEERFKRYAAELVAIQAARTKRYGTSGRALHRKGLLPLRARFEVLSEIPEHARHGLFAVPGMHDAWVRLSNKWMCWSAARSNRKRRKGL